MIIKYKSNREKNGKEHCPRLEARMTNSNGVHCLPISGTSSSTVSEVIHAARLLAWPKELLKKSIKLRNKLQFGR